MGNDQVYRFLVNINEAVKKVSGKMVVENTAKT